MTVEHQITDDGKVVPVDSLPQILEYDAQGRLARVAVFYQGVEYAQTLGYDAQGRLSSVSAWEVQP